MHVPTGFCSITVAAAGAGLAAGALIASQWRLRDVGQRMAPSTLAALTAAVFAAQMLNIQVDGGTSGHLVGGALLGILAGPAAGLIAMASLLGVQAFLFADGGIAALGLNVLNMGVVGVLGGWALHRALAGASPSRVRSATAAAIAGWTATVAGAALCAVELALSGSAPLGAALSAMVGIHLVIGAIEAGATAAVVAVAHRRSAAVPAMPLSWPLAAAVIACAIAPFASSLPDGLEASAEALGFASAAVTETAPLADYAMPGLQGSLTVILAGLIGAVVVASLTWIAARALPQRSAI